MTVLSQCNHDNPVRKYYRVALSDEKKEKGFSDLTFDIFCGTCHREIPNEEYQKWWADKFLSGEKK